MYIHENKQKKCIFLACGHAKLAVCFSWHFLKNICSPFQIFVILQQSHNLAILWLYMSTLNL